ncbi:MAG: uroporphyrinogen-III synthase [Gammaproteobacteria bacterium]|nr:uroporphyrinogen-III synthase [Gammaproteobacteria bacterium]
MSGPLTGCCVLNTRPIHQAQALTESIQTLGGEVISCPALAISGLSPEWKNTLPPLHTFDLAIFISANAVSHFFSAIPAAHWPTTLPVVAIGPATAAKLQQLCINIDSVPALANSETLLTLPSFAHLSNKKILMIKGKAGRDFLSLTLRQQQALVTEVAVYERTMPDIPTDYLEQIWRNAPINIILFTSEQAMKHLFIMFGTAAHEWLKNTPCLVISQRLAHAATALGIKTVFTTRPDTLLTGLVAAYTLKRNTP